MNNRNFSRGFTMIELMIVIIIMVIIISFAYPAYNDQIRKSRRAEATGKLLEVAGAQERFFTRNNAYAANMTTLGYGADNEPTANGHYLVATARVVNPPSYTITATPQGDQANDALCANLTLNSLGQKGETGTGQVKDCW